MTRPKDNAKLDTCGCCEAETPGPAHTNVPGLPELRYRVGNHPVFLDRMKARIHRWTVPDGEHAGKRPLRALATRAGDDPAMAMMDAWATVADVLTFYQERTANEGFLRTATERRSVLELARAIGYELNLGVAASTYVAFTVDDAEDSLTETSVPAGTQIQSIPSEQDELPQTFETTEDLTAHLSWNAMRLRLKHPQTLTATMTHVYLDGTATNLEAGDLALLVLGGTPHPKKIVNIAIDKDAQHTRIDFALTLSEPSTTLATYPDATLDLTKEQLDFTAANVEDSIFKKSWQEKDLQAFLTLHDWDGEQVLAYVAELRSRRFESDDRKLFALREQVGFFGHNAPYFQSLPDKEDSSGGSSSALPEKAEMMVEKKAPGKMIVVDPCPSTKYWPKDWDCLNLSIWKDSLTSDYYYDKPSGEYYDVYLEQPVEGLAPGTWAVFECPKRPLNEFVSYLIADVTEVSRAGFGMSTKVTGLDLTDAGGQALDNNSSDKPDSFKVRTSRAFVKGETLALAALPVTDDLHAGDTELWLGTMVLGLAKGQTLAMTGEELDTDGQERTEMLVLKEILHSGGYTRLTFEEGISCGYKRDTVTLNANVVLANHGETVSGEVLGGGDGAATHQRFELKKPPLTYVSASTASGVESTLSVRVDGVEWNEASSLYGLGSNDKSYTVRIDNETKASVMFGDGDSGARLPTGQENVVATYRSGIGSEGEVDAGSLILLKTRPFGIRGVTNPLAASGADDPETLDEAQANAPLTVLTLDRIVSVQDYEDFARAFSGIGKARADIIWDGQAERVHVTVADANGDPVVAPLYGNLLAAMESARDPLRQVVLKSFQPLVFFVTAKILIDGAYLWEDVKDAAEQALLSAFSFSKRSFAQPVTAAEVLQVIHSVPGVKAVDLDELYKTTPETPAPSGSLFNAVLDARPARYSKGEAEPLSAELLLIHELGVNLSEMTS